MYTKVKHNRIKPINSVVYQLLIMVFVITLLSCSTQKNEQGKNEDDAAASLLQLKVAGYDFVRVAALFDGRVQIEGCDAQFQVMGIGEMNTHVFNGPQTLDITEIGLHPYMLAYANEGFRDYTLLPIFPLRLFRHKSIFIRTDRGITSPGDLIGKTIATPGYSSTSLTWIRGILQEEYGIKPQDINWILSTDDSSAKLAGKASEQEQIVPNGITIIRGDKGKDESDLLESGEADALFHAAEPRAYIENHPDIGRLFPDYRRVEQDYYSATGIFPIMHAVAIKTTLLKEHPWLAKAVFDAYSEAKQIAYKEMNQKGWLYDMLPWYGQELENTQSLMGDNFYSYGIEANRITLEALLKYSYQQDLTNRELTVEEIFDPSGLSLQDNLQ